MNLEPRYTEENFNFTKNFLEEQRKTTVHRANELREKLDRMNARMIRELMEELNVSETRLQDSLEENKALMDINTELVNRNDKLQKMCDESENMCKCKDIEIECLEENFKELHEQNLEYFQIIANMSGGKRKKTH